MLHVIWCLSLSSQTLCTRLQHEVEPARVLFFSALHMAPKKGPAPTLVGDRAVNLMILVEDQTLAEQLQRQPRFLETIVRDFNSQHCEVITSASVKTCWDEVLGQRVVLNEEIRHLFQDRVWQSFVDKQDFAEVGYMVSVMHCLRLQRALTTERRDDNFLLFVDARVMKPDELTFDLFRSACHQRFQAFQTPPALVAMGASVSRSMLPASQPIPKGWERVGGDKLSMAWASNNKSIGLEDVRDRCWISAQAVLLHSKTIASVLQHGFQASTLQESWYIAAQMSTMHKWQNGSIMCAWPPPFVTSSALDWFTESRSAPQTSRFEQADSGEAILVELATFCGFSNRLHIMTAALAAAHFAGLHLVVIWDPSVHCPTDFHDCWQVRQRLPSWFRCRSIHIVGQRSQEAQELRERFQLDEADMTGFATCDVLLRELHSEVRKLLQQDGKPEPEPLDDTLLAMWQMWQPAQRCVQSAEQFVSFVKENSGCDLVAGVHYRRGDLKTLMQKSYGKQGSEGQTVDYERYDQEFVQSAKLLLLCGYALIICTDTLDGFQFWSNKLKGCDHFYFNPSSESRAKKSHAQMPHELRQTTHEEFTTDLCLLMQCDRFLGTSESTVRHVVMYGRQQPFCDPKIIGLVPWGFRHITGKATNDVRNLAKRLALRWSTAPTRGSCEWLSLSDEHALILVALPEQAIMELWGCMMNRMLQARDPSVHGSWLGATELPASVEAARRQWKALSKATAGHRAGRRPAGFLSAVTWTRMREWCMSQGETCPLSWGDRFIMVTRENLMADMTLLRMLGQADAGTVTVMTEEPLVPFTASASSSGPRESAVIRSRGDVPFPPKAMQVAVSRPKWAGSPSAPPAKRQRL